jgi:hypothetical protein
VWEGEGLLCNGNMSGGIAAIGASNFTTVSEGANYDAMPEIPNVCPL